MLIQFITAAIFQQAIFRLRKDKAAAQSLKVHLKIYDASVNSLHECKNK